MTKTDPTPDQRDAVYARAEMCCERCGKDDGPFAVHHRKTRKRGGGNELSNLVLLCDMGGCHDTEVHLKPRSATLDGWLVASWADPATTPLLRRGQWVHLLDDGDIDPHVGAA